MITPKHNKFEIQANALLNEDWRDNLKAGANAVQSTLKNVTDSKLFDGPGNINNKFDPKKNYYPNIRSGWYGLKNTNLNEASQKVITIIKQYQNIKAEDPAWNPSSGPKSSEGPIISKQYSQQFLPQAQEALKAAQNNVAQVRDAMVGGDVGKLVGLSMYQKAHLDSYEKSTKDAASKWMAIINTSADPQNPKPIDTNEKMVPGTTFLKTDITIYRDQWENFLNVVMQAVVGAGQRGYTAGASASSILRGKAVGKRDLEGKVEYTNTDAIEPNIIEQFHNKIMISLFMSDKNKTLIYATPEQWESISKGGRLYKGLTGAGKEVFQAGGNIPKVRL